MRSAIQVVRDAYTATRGKHNDTTTPPPLTGSVWVFSGGGAAAAAQVGMAQALLEAGHRPDVLVGCSAGALNAAFLAEDPTVERAVALRQVWAGLADHSPLRANPFMVVGRLIGGRSYLLDPHSLDHLVSSLVSDHSFEDLKVPLHVVSSALPEGEQCWHTTGRLTSALLASCALPGLLPPVRLSDGRLHVDGGVTNTFPIDYALAMGHANVWALDAAGSAEPCLSSTKATDILMAGFSVSLRSQASRTGALLADPRVHHIRAFLPRSQKVGLRDFRSGPQMMDAGYEAARRLLEEEKTPVVSSQQAGSGFLVRKLRTAA